MTVTREAQDGRRVAPLSFRRWGKSPGAAAIAGGFSREFLRGRWRIWPSKRSCPSALRKNHAQKRIGTPRANGSPMSQPQITPAFPPRPTPARPEATLVSLVAGKAGRDIIWVLIAGAFLLVEAVVFLKIGRASCRERV